MLKDLLLYGKAPADPWNRVHCCSHSVLALVEFCQTVGPKPLLHCPLDLGPHLDLDQVALWLMSLWNHHGSQVMLYNQHLDLHAIVYHITLLDVTARAYQRPAALAFLSSEKPTAEQRKLFTRLSNDLLRPVLACNRRIFRSYGEHIIDFANEIQHRRLNAYYTLVAHEGVSHSFKNKIQKEAKAMQILLRGGPRKESGSSLGAATEKPLNLHFMDMYRLISSHPTFCDCGRDLREFDKYVRVTKLNEAKWGELVPLLDLSPCVKDTFSADFDKLYERLVSKPAKKGVLFSGGEPVFKRQTGSNVAFVPAPSQGDGDVSVQEIGKQFPNENSLRCLGSSLVQCLYPLMSGEKVLILASEQRLSTAVDLLQKLNVLRVCRVAEPCKWLTALSAEEPSSYEPQLKGCTASREESAGWSAQAARPVLLDLNNHRLVSMPYEGRWLQPLASAKLFPSDGALLHFVVSLVCDICLFARVCRRVPLDEVAQRFKLKKQDVLMVAQVLAEYDMVRFLSGRVEMAKSVNRWTKKLRFAT